MTTALFPANVRLRPIALPVEHGGWGFVLEPVLLALLLAPSGSGLLLGLAIFAAFLTRQPLKILWTDRSAGKWYPRTQAAMTFVFLYATPAAVFFLLGVALSSWQVLLPFLAASPLLLITILKDADQQSRTLVPEIAAPAALAATAAAMVMAGGWSFAAGSAVWALLVCRSVPSVFYVRARLCLEYGKPAVRWPSHLLHLGAIAAALLLTAAGLAPDLVGVPFIILLVRAGIGLSRWRRKSTPKAVGFTEIFYGALTVGLLALAYLPG